jgi:hypothetical protein
VTALSPHHKGVSRPDGRSGNHRKVAGEESPGSIDIRCRITSGGGNPRESATENEPPCEPPQGARRARVKRCGKSAPRLRQRNRHGKPHREQDRIGTATRAARESDNSRERCQALAVRVGCSRRCANIAPEEWPSRIASRKRGGALQNPAYRLADTLRNEGFGATRRTPRHFRIEIIRDFSGDDTGASS